MQDAEALFTAVFADVNAAHVIPSVEVINAFEPP
jgi:hypothetical protein